MESNVTKKSHLEKIGVYLAALTFLFMFVFKVNDLSERIAKIEGKLEILVTKEEKK